MKKALVAALAMAGLGVQAHAADWVPPKSPGSSIPDNLTWYGITPIGVL